MITEIRRPLSALSRHLFPSLASSTHLISHSLGAMPARVRDRLAAYADQWDTRSIRSWNEGWWRMPLTVGDKIAPLLGAAPGSVVMQPNVSVAQWIVLSCFDWTGPRNKLVAESLQFPTNSYIFQELTRLGAAFERVPSPDGITVPTEAMLAAIDKRTQLVCVSHVLFRSSYVQDLAAITAKAHSVGAMVVADVYQSAGCLPLDLAGWGVDFATGGSVKWLCGGPGAGYLYVRPDLAAGLRPRLTGWNAHARPFAFEEPPIDYAPDMFRFLHGTPAIPALFAAESGYEIVAEMGVERIRENSLRQTRRLMELADAAGFPVRTPRADSERGGVVVIDVPDGQWITEELARRDVLFDYRPGAGIRLGPHFYNTDEEIEAVMAQIAELSGRRRE